MFEKFVLYAATKGYNKVMAGDTYLWDDKLQLMYESFYKGFEACYEQHKEFKTQRIV